MAVKNRVEKLSYVEKKHGIYYNKYEKGKVEKEKIKFQQHIMKYWETKINCFTLDVFYGFIKKKEVLFIS